MNKKTIKEIINKHKEKMEMLNNGQTSPAEHVIFLLVVGGAVLYFTGHFIAYLIR